MRRTVKTCLQSFGALVAGATVGVVAIAAAASAHVEVSADKPQAGATKVTITFTGEAESDNAGITSERVFLPTGITPADVTLGKAPAGWKLTATTDGYTVSGKALRPGTDAVHSVVLAQLPTDAKELVFKVLESYSDGTVSRWIGLQEPGQSEPDNPAPVLKLKAAAPAPTSSSAAAPVSPSAAASTASTPAEVPAPTNDAAPSTGTSHAGLWITLAVIIVLALIAAGILITRRRRASPSQP